jgi:C-terminal processing protease CtpA/Prc
MMPLIRFRFLSGRWLGHIALVALCLAVLLALDSKVYPQRSLTTAQYTEDFDLLWSTINGKYAYFERKQTDWDRVRQIYRPQLEGLQNSRDFIALLEKVLEELYDPHTHLGVNTIHSTRLVPTGLDVWAELRNGRAIITQIRKGFSAEQSGLKVGMEITSINGVPMLTAVNHRVGVSLRTVDDRARSWALLALLAGTREHKRIITARANGKTSDYLLDLPEHKTVDNFQGDKNVEWRLEKGNVGYIKISNLGNDETVSQFDSALDELRSSSGLILDLRSTQSGGNTSVAEPILGRFVTKAMPYQKGQAARGAMWVRKVTPRGWAYTAPLAVLVGRWTASMGEGMAIGLDGMKRGTVVGSQMAGLNGAVFDFELPNTRIRVNYAAERLFHVDGTARENFVPRFRGNGGDRPDPDLAIALRILQARGARRSSRNGRH